MYLPELNTKSGESPRISSFKGFSEREIVSGNQFSKMLNMSSRRAPAASPRLPREEIGGASGMSLLLVPEHEDAPIYSFTGIADGSFYYMGEKIDGPELSDEKKSMADFNGCICIFPDKLYYRYLKDPETGETDKSLKHMDSALTVSSVRFYSALSDITGEYTAYISKTDAGFDEYFKVGDSIKISGASNEQNNTFIVDGRDKFASENQIVSAVVDAVTKHRIDLLLYTKSGSPALFKNNTEVGEITVSLAIPDIDHVCVHGNRLWGTAKNGEYIYSSKLGDPFNFNSFQGIASDSWYSAVGTGGKFQGIYSYRSSVVAFKKNYIHHIYGDNPQNFSIPKQTFGGTIDGDSVVQLGGVLYYMAKDGFYAYTGGEPEKISSDIITKYTKCCAGEDGEKYYACAKRADDNCDLLVYTPEYCVWHMEDHTPFCGFAKYGGDLYAASSDELYRFGSGDEEVNWCVVSARFTIPAPTRKTVREIYLRMDLKMGAKVRISFSRDGGEFETCGNVIGSGFSVHRIPIRPERCESFRVMIEGTGDAAIHDIEIITQTGGRNVNYG